MPGQLWAFNQESAESVISGIENALRVPYTGDVMQQLRVVWALHRVSAQHKLDEAAWIEAAMLGN